MPTKKIVVTDPLSRFRKVFSSVEAPKGGLPTMPTKVSNLASEELGDMMARYTAWREFTEDRHAEACATWSQLSSQYSLAVDKAFISSEAESVTERKAQANCKQEVMDLFKQMNEADVYKSLLANKLDSFSNVLAMLSRELTRRGVNQ